MIFFFFLGGGRFRDLSQNFWVFRDGTDRQTDRHGDSMTNSAQWGELVKTKKHVYARSGTGDRKGSSQSLKRSLHLSGLS